MVRDQVLVFPHEHAAERTPILKKPGDTDVMEELIAAQELALDAIFSHADGPVN